MAAGTPEPPEPRWPSIPPLSAYGARWGQRGSPALRWRGRPAAEASPAPTGGPTRAPAAPGAGFERNTWIVGFAWAFGAFLGLQAVGIGILLAIESDPSDEALLLAALITTAVVDVVAFAAIPILVLGGRGRALPALGLRQPSLLTVGWGSAGLVMALALLAAYLGIVELIGVEALEPVSTIDDDEIYSSAGRVALTGVLVVLIAPVTEEIFYRGFLIGALTRRFGLPAAVIASAVLFSAVHLDVGSLIPFALIGMTFTWVYVRSRQLASAMVAHFLFNAIAFAAVLVENGVG